MFDDYSNIRFFSVSPPSLDRVPRPRTVLFEDRFSTNKENEIRSVYTSDTVETPSNCATSTDSNTHNKHGSVNDSTGTTNSLDPPANLEKRHSLTRRDFVLDETVNATRTTRMLDSYDLDVRLGVKPRYYQKWARNKRSRSTIDVASVIQPFSMLIRQQNSASNNSAKRNIGKRKKSTTTVKRRVNFERALSNMSSDYELENKPTKATRKSIAGTCLSSVNVGNVKLGLVKKDTKDENVWKLADNEQLELARTSGTTDTCIPKTEIIVNEAKEESNRLEDKQHKLHRSSVIEFNNESLHCRHTKPNNQRVHHNDFENGILNKGRKDEENIAQKKVAFDIKTELNIATTLLSADIIVGVSNQSARTEKSHINDIFDKPDTSLPENYRYYPARPIFNDILKRREKQSALISSELIPFRKLENAEDGPTNNIDRRKEAAYRGKVPVTLSKASPRYSGPNNLFVDFDTLRITAHLQKLEQYRTSTTRSPLTITPPRRFSSVTSPVQVIDRHGLNTVVIGFSAK